MELNPINISQNHSVQGHNQIAKKADNNSSAAPVESFQSVSSADAGLMDPEKMQEIKAKLAASLLQAGNAREVWHVDVLGSKVYIGERQPGHDGIYLKSDNHLKKYSYDGELTWAVDLKSETLSRPVFDTEGNLYLSVDNTLTSVDPSGNVRWQQTIEGTERCSLPLIHENNIYVSGPEQVVTKFDLQGNKQWDIKVNTENCRPLFMDDHGRLHLESFGHSVHTIIDTKNIGPDGKPAISELDGGYSLAPQVTDSKGNLYVSKDGNLVARTAEGKQIWTKEMPDRENISSIGQFIGPDGNVYVEFDTQEKSYPYTRSSYLKCLTPQGDEVWGKQTPPGEGTYRKNLAWAPDGSLYITAEDKKGSHIESLDTRTGEMKWRTCDEKDRQLEFLVGPDGTVYSGGFEHKIHAYSPETGKKYFDCDADLFNSQFIDRYNFITISEDCIMKKLHLATDEEFAEDAVKNATEAASREQVRKEEGFVDIDGVNLKKRVKRYGNAARIG